MMMMISMMMMKVYKKNKRHKFVTPILCLEDDDGSIDDDGEV